MLKAVGYLVSSLSVVCLGIVSWSSAAERPLMLALLIVGMGSSIIGMAIRLWSHLRDKRPDVASRLREEAAQIRISK